MNRRNPVLVAWGAGLALAAAVYIVGADRFWFRVVDTLHVLAWRVSEVISDLSLMTLDVVRALAIGLYATFVVLAVAVARRGGRARGALVVVSVVFLLLVGGADDGAGPNGRWAAALVLAAIGSLVMTGRLRQPGVIVVPR